MYLIEYYLISMPMAITDEQNINSNINFSSFDKDSLVDDQS